MINGVLNIYKEKGYTSHDVVAKLRGIVEQKKIGHTGTLDPDAEGVLPVCLGKATKLCDMLTDQTKVYETVLLLGTVTDTQDLSGTILETKDTYGLSREEVSRCIRDFEGDYDQIPPMYSALKVNGRKLYELAREGRTIERTPRRVRIYAICILEVDLPRVRMQVECSKGTYIRTLCHDIGEKLGCGGCMEQLVRTKTGLFERKDSLTLTQVEEYRRSGRFREILIPVDALFADHKAVTVKKMFEQSAYNGNELGADQVINDTALPEGEQVRVYDCEAHFVGIFRYHEKQKKYTVEKMFLDQEEIKG